MLSGIGLGGGRSGELLALMCYRRLFGGLWLRIQLSLARGKTSDGMLVQHGVMTCQPARWRGYGSAVTLHVKTGQGVTLGSMNWLSTLR